MRPIYWILPLLAALLALLNTRTGSAECQDCNLLQVPDAAALFVPVKFSLPYPPPPAREEWRLLPPEQRLASTRSRVQAPLEQALKAAGLRLGHPAFLRIFKESKELELWLKGPGGWKLFRTYPVAAMSGRLGPKLAEGDGQAPEGVYGLTKQSLNPASLFHLSFNIGYPNAYDRHHGRTGTHIMVHGNEVSVGCFAMTDPVVEEIYLLVEAALKKNAAEVPVHVFPFRLDSQRLIAETQHACLPFWMELRPVYETFEKDRRVPKVEVQDGRYVVMK